MASFGFYGQITGGVLAFGYDTERGFSVWPGVQGTASTGISGAGSSQWSWDEGWAAPQVYVGVSVPSGSPSQIVPTVLENTATHDRYVSVGYAGSGADIGEIGIFLEGGLANLLPDFIFSDENSSSTAPTSITFPLGTEAGLPPMVSPNAYPLGIMTPKGYYPPAGYYPSQAELEAQPGPIHNNCYHAPIEHTITVTGNYALLMSTLVGGSPLSFGTIGNVEVSQSHAYISEDDYVIVPSPRNYASMYAEDDDGQSDDYNGAPNAGSGPASTRSLLYDLTADYVSDDDYDHTPAPRHAHIVYDDDDDDDDDDDNDDDDAQIEDEGPSPTAPEPVYRAPVPEIESRSRQAPDDPGYDGPQPILLDLDGNGIRITEQSRSGMFVDAGGDGLKHRTAWAGAGGGALFYDPDGTGAISEKRQYVFTEWGERRKRNGPVNRFRQRTRGAPTATDDLAEYLAALHSRRLSVISKGALS